MRRKTKEAQQLIIHRHGFIAAIADEQLKNAVSMAQSYSMWKGVRVDITDFGAYE